MARSDCEFATVPPCEQPARPFEDRMLCDEHRYVVETHRAKRSPLRPADVHAVLVDLLRDARR